MKFKTLAQRNAERMNSPLSFKGEALPISDAPNNVRAVPMTAPKSYIPWTENKDFKTQEAELNKRSSELSRYSKYFERAEELSKRSPILRQAQTKALNSQYGISDEESFNRFINDYAALVSDTERLAKKYNLAAENEATRYKLWQSSLRPYAEVQSDIDALDSETFELERQRSENLKNNMVNDGMFKSPTLQNSVLTEEGKKANAEIASKLEDAKKRRESLQREKKDSQDYYYSTLKDREDFSKNNGRDASGKMPRNPEYSGREPTAMSYATDEELEIYNYLFNTEGSKAAGDYASFMSDTWNRRKAGEKVAKTEALPVVLEQISKARQSFGAGVERFGQGVYSAITGKTANTTAQQFAKQTYREKSNGIGKAVYDLSESIGNMAPGILLSAVTGSPTAGLVSIGASSGGNAYNEARKNGASKADAYAYGTLVGTSEAMLGKALGGITALGGSSKLFSDKLGTAISAKINAIDKAYLAIASRFGSKFVTNGIQEGVEEGIQTILEPIFATMVLDEKYKPAELLDVGYSALLGFLSAGFLEGGNTTAEYFNAPLDQKVIDKYISDGEKAAENSLERAIADDIKAKLAANPNAKLTGFDVGRIARYYKDTRKAEKKANKELKKTLIETAENETTSPTPAEAPATPQPEEQLTEFEEATPVNDNTPDVTPEPVANKPTTSSEPTVKTTPTVSRDGIEIKPETDPEIQARVASAKDELERTGILSGASDTTINTVRRLSKLLKTDIRFEAVSKIAGKDGNTYDQNGRYDLDDGIIYINMGSGTDTYTQIIAHEFTHSVEGTKLYTLLEKYARKFHNGKAGEGAFNANAREILEQYRAAGKDYDIRKAQAEVVSNYVADELLNNEANIELLVKENRTLAEKLKDIVDKVLSVIGKDGTKKEAQTRAKLTRMSKLLSDALKARDSRTNKTSDIKSRYKELRRKILSEEISEEDYEAELDELDNEALSMGLDLQELMRGEKSYSISKLDKISMDTTEEERARILSKKTIIAPIYEGQADETIISETDNLLHNDIKIVKAAIKKIGEEFNVFTDGENIPIKDMNFGVFFSRGGADESTNKKVIDIKQLAKLLPLLWNAVENSVGIECHENRYFYDTSVKEFYELLGGYIEGNDFIPVRFGVKHFVDGTYSLYIVVCQDKIEKTKVIRRTPRIVNDIEASRPRLVSNISISQIAKFVNSKDLLRYLPDGFLDNNQIKLKYEGIADTIKYTNDKNDKKYKDYIKRKDYNSVQRMVDEAARKAEYDTDAYHGTNQGDFTVFDWDKTQRTDGGFYGRGHYFTKFKGVAERYGKRVVNAKLKLGKTFVWSDEVNSYEGKKPPELLSLNIVSRINMAKIFPDIFANQTMSYWEYDSHKGENVEKTIKWGEIEGIINSLSKGLFLREYADGTYRWHTEGRFWEVPVGESFSSKEKADEGKFFAAINALKEKYDGLLSDMTFDDQTTYTQRYGTEITETLKKKGYHSAMDTQEGGEIVVFDSNQIKSADPVVYDDNGNVIPISQRFNSDKDNILYSITPEKAAEESIDKSTSEASIIKRLPIQSLGKLRAVEKGLRKVVGDIYKIKYARVDELKPAIRKLTEKYLSEGKITAEDITEFTDFINNAFGIESTKEDTNRVRYQLNEAITEDLKYIRNFFKQLEKDANAQPEWVQESREERAKRFSNKKIREFRNWVREEFSVPESEKETLDALIANVVARIENGTVPKSVIDSFFGAAFNSAEVTEDSLKRDFPDVYRALRRDKLTLTESEKSDLAGYDSYKEFREDAQGYLNLGKDGTSVEDMYAFCHELAPSLFPIYIDNTNDQAVRLLEVSKMFTPKKRWAFEKMTQEEREKLYDELTKQVLDLARDVTTSQKYAQGTSTVEQESEVESNDVDVEELLEVMEKMKKERKKMLSARGRTILSEKDEGALRAILDGHITVDQLSDEYNKKDIEAIYEASKEYTRLKNIVDEQRRQIHERRYDMARKYLADGDILTGFRDRNHGLLYMLNPMERNLRYIGKRSQLSEDLIDAYIKPIKRANKNAILYKNSIVQKIEDLGLSRKVKAGDEFSEAYAVQFVGEAENNIKYLKKLNDNRATKDGHTLEEWQTMLDNFWKVNPGINRNKINNAVDVFREVYDDLFKKMNESRVRNGYEPISYRRGYFPHFSPKESNDILAQFGKSLGITVEFSGLPTDINGLTQNFRPGMRYQAFANERLGFETVFDAVEGLHRYLDTAADVIYQTDNICNLRALSQQIRYQASDEGKRKREDFIRLRTDLDETERAAVLDKIHEGGKYTLSNFVNDLEEYTNLLAGKKSKWDRGAEALFGRSLYGLMKNVSGRIAANMVAWNVGSWLTNFIPLVQGATGLDTKYMLVGMKEAMRNLHEADGFESQSVWLTTRRGSEELLKRYELTNIPTSKLGKALDKEALHKIGRAFDKSAEIGMIPMEAIDMFVSNTLVRGRYHQNIGKGMTEEAALEEADSWVAGIMADRSKGGLPTIFGATNPMVKLLTQFQVEVANQIGFFFSDLPIQLRDKEAKAIVLAIAKYVIGAYLYNELYELLTGRRPALDPLGIINDSIGDFSGKKFRDPVDAIVSLAKGKSFLDDAYKLPLGEAMWEFTIELAEEVPFVGGLLGGGRIPISSALPSVPNIIKSVGKDGAWGKVGKELLKPVTYSVLPGGGGQISKAVKGISALAQGGKYGTDTKGREILQYPVTPNPWTATRSVLFGPTATKGGKDWIDSNFKSSLSHVETKAYKEAVYEGMTQDDAYDLIDTISSAGDKNSQKIAALNDAKVPQSVKRAVYEQMFLSESPTKAATLNALDEVGAYRDVVIDFMLEHPEVSSQEELMAIFGDKIKAGRIVGNSSSFTKKEKAAILQTVLPNTKSNPYWPELKESVYYVVHPDVKLEDEEKKRNKK